MYYIYIKLHQTSSLRGTTLLEFETCGVVLTCFNPSIQKKWSLGMIMFHLKSNAKLPGLVNVNLVMLIKEISVGFTKKYGITWPSGKRLHNYGKSPCYQWKKSTISTGPFSIAMLVYQRVTPSPSDFACPSSSQVAGECCFLHVQPILRLPASASTPHSAQTRGKPAPKATLR